MNDFIELALKENIENFIAEKRLMGYRYRNEEQKLLSFLQYIVDHRYLFPLSKDVILAWVDDAEGGVSRNHRISVIRQFALYINRTMSNTPAYVVPAVYRTITRKDFCPYIFSKKEILGLFQTADMYGKYGRVPHSEASFPLILRILYCCGLRISEVLSLKVKDVDLKNGILIIRDTKFFKDRCIPMHNNLTERCINYFENALVIADQDEYFFPSGKKHRIKSDTFYQYYRKILHLAGIRNCNASGGPRLHDIRHTFAVHCLKELNNSGYDMNYVIPILATYMGHTCYEGTETYLHLTAELYPEILNAVEEKYGAIIPLGGWDDAY